MVVFDTVDVVLDVHSERHPIQTLFTHHTAKTARMVGLAKCLEDLNTHTHTYRKNRCKIRIRLGSEAMEVMQYHTVCCQSGRLFKYRLKTSAQ